MIGDSTWDVIAAGRLDVKTIALLTGGSSRAELSEAGANVLEVAHERTSTTLHIGEVEIGLQLETRGSPHAESVLAHLRGRGYQVIEQPPRDQPV